VVVLLLLVPRFKARHLIRIFDVKVRIAPHVNVVTYAISQFQSGDLYYFICVCTFYQNRKWGEILWQKEGQLGLLLEP
jgi:hypothetical protein